MKFSKCTTDNDKLSWIAGRLDRYWSVETSSDPDGWRKRNPVKRKRLIRVPERLNPAWGQCAVTALIVQDLVGGDLVRVVATLPDNSEVSHYFNRLVDGRDVDLTRHQFPEGTIFSRPERRTRQYVLSYEMTAWRYMRLMTKITIARIREERTDFIAIMGFNPYQ